MDGKVAGNVSARGEARGECQYDGPPGTPGTKIDQPYDECLRHGITNWVHLPRLNGFHSRLAMVAARKHGGIE